MFFSRQKTVKKGAATVATAVSIAMPFVAYEEGLRTKAYLDSVGVPTICYGETENVKLGDVKTVDECNKLFHVKLGMFSAAVDMAVGPEMSPEFHAALTSWAYNVGIGAMRKSTLIKKANSGDFAGACNELPRWKYAGGKAILLGRRLREKSLCLTNI